MIRSKQVLEWQAQAYTRGRAETLLEVLQERLGSLPPTVVEQVKGVNDPAVLQGWLKLALRATTLDQFLHDSGAATNGA